MEFPLIKKAWNKNIKTLAVVYPNLYYGGVYCLAPLIVYNIVNTLPDWICERQFLDNHKDLSKFDLVGFTVQYEPDSYNIINLIKKYKPKITFAGGPCINQNPKFLSKYIDFFILGEAEDILPKVLRVYNTNTDKEDFLKSISKLEGVYVPKYSKEITYTFVEDLNKVQYPLYQPLPEKITKEFVFGKVFMLETERGCPYLCKFCPTGHKKPRYRSITNLKEIIDKGIRLNKRDKVIIYSPSFTHPDKKELLKYLLSKNLKFSIPSIKVEHIDRELIKLIKLGGQKTLTIAPETNERLRKSIGKFTTDSQFFEFVKLAKEFYFETIKVYLMIGLPEQTQKDLEETVLFIEKLKSLFKNLYISVNPFIPKQNTEFSEYKFDKKTIKQQADYFRMELGKLKVRYKISSIESSHKKWILATSISYYNRISK